MKRRTFIEGSLLGSAGAIVGRAPNSNTKAQRSDIKVRKISFYQPPDPGRPLMAQSKAVVVVECDNGIIGVGEGGSADTIKNVAGWLIGQDPLRSEHLWQLMLRGYFYPGGRELQHAIGALDMALWDIKGKILDTPVYNLLGGRVRDYIELYSTGYPRQGSLTETARHCVEAGFKAFRTHGKANTGVYDVHRAVEDDLEHCRQIYEGVKGKGEWAIDFHARYNKPNAIRLAKLLEPLDPLFVEDLIRSENQDIYKVLRQQINVPLALGEQFGFRWDFNRLVEEDIMDYSRVTLPNCAGITEYKKIMSMCETHYIGVIPHFTGPISTAALTHCLASFSGFAMMEFLGDQPAEAKHLNDDYLAFRKGHLYPRDAPGLGIQLNTSLCTKILEVDTAINYDFPMLRRPDGSFTNW